MDTPQVYVWDSKTPNDMKIYIYGMTDPREPEIIRYVGQTENLAIRFARHLSGRDTNTSKWIGLLRGQGAVPSIKVLETSDDRNANECEIKWINHYKETCSECNLKILKPKAFEFRVSPITSLRDMEIRYIRWALDYTNGNKLAASKLLGIGRQTLYNKLAASES